MSPSGDGDNSVAMVIAQMYGPVVTSSEDCSVVMIQEFLSDTIPKKNTDI